MIQTALMQIFEFRDEIVGDSTVEEVLRIQDMDVEADHVLGWSGRTRLLREFQLRRREKFLYTYDFLDLWEWEIRVLDIEAGSAEAWRPRCLGRDATARVRRSARVHANSGSAQVLSARDRTGVGREGLAAHSGSTAGPGSSRLAQGAARSRAGKGRATAQRIRTIST